MVQWVTLPPVMHESMNVPMLCHLLSQVTANGLGKAVKDCPSVWSPATHMNDLDEAPN